MSGNSERTSREASGRPETGKSGEAPEKKPLLQRETSQSGNASRYMPKENVPPLRSGSTASGAALSDSDSDSDEDLERERVTSARLLKTPAKGKVGPQRTSRTAQKLKLLPGDPVVHGEARLSGAEGGNETRESSRNISGGRQDVYSQAHRITDAVARRDAERLGKKHRRLLPRCTAYCSASSYNMRELVYWLKSAKQTHHTHPRLFDECLYTPFQYTDWRGDSKRTAPRLGSEDQDGDDDDDDDDDDDESPLLDEGVSDKHPSVFVFEYGVVVLWGFTEREERSFLTDIERFEREKLAEEDVQVEEFNYYVTDSYQPRIYNDFITLRDGSNYMVKLSISHAVAQSVKISLFEELVANTIDDTEDIPQEIASSGTVSMSKEDIMKSIGELFILRININLHGSVLDSPEIMWSEPQLEPIYQATRGYLEINQRVALLNQRLEVISDLLQMLKEQLGHSHEEYLEFIVIVLVGVEVLISGINIAVDMMAR